MAGDDFPELENARPKIDSTEHECSELLRGKKAARGFLCVATHSSARQKSVMVGIWFRVYPSTFCARLSMISARQRVFGRRQGLTRA